MDDECGGNAETLCLSGLPDIRTELPEVREYLFDAHIGLAERTGIDGFRLDTVKHISHDFWQNIKRPSEIDLGQNFYYWEKFGAQTSTSPNPTSSAMNWMQLQILAFVTEHLSF